MASWIVLAAVALLIAGMVAKAKARHLRVQREIQKDFFDVACVLVRSDETPESVVKLIMTMGELIRNKWVPWQILAMFLTGKMRKIAANPELVNSAPLRDAARMNDDLRKQFGIALAAFVLAVTLSSVSAGWLMRRMAFYRVRKARQGQYLGGEDVEALVMTFKGRVAA